MARHSFFLGVTACLLAFLAPALGDDVNAWNIFTVDRQKTTHGGCGARMDVLDLWLTKGSLSLFAAMDAVEHYLDDDRGPVREAMLTFFGIALPTTKKNKPPPLVEFIRNRLENVADYYNFRRDDGTTPKFDPATRFLFCHSDFLERHTESDLALDFQGKVIKDKDDNEVTIGEIPTYKARIRQEKNAIPWWAGPGGVNEYYFTQTGGDFCNEKGSLGLTPKIEPLKDSKGVGRAARDKQIDMIIICPYAFDESPQPDNYRDVNNLLSTGRNLKDAVPKSATLLHELFHAIYGTDVLFGKAEYYDIAQCLELGEKQPKNARKNIENFVFFIAHMYHLYGEEDGDQPWSIKKNWDFTSEKVEGDDGEKNMVYGAIEIGGDPMDIDDPTEVDYPTDVDDPTDVDG